MSCLTLEDLLAYWQRDDTTADDRVEEHIFECDACSSRLEAVASLAGGVRGAVRRGWVGAAVTADTIGRLARDGLVFREYHLAPGSAVACTIGPSEHVMVSRLAANFGAAERVDIVWEGAGPPVRQEDVPVDRAGGEVVLTVPGDIARTWPDQVQIVRLLAVGRDGTERALGEYTFRHKGFVA